MTADPAALPREMPGLPFPLELIEKDAGSGARILAHTPFDPTKVVGMQMLSMNSRDFDDQLKKMIQEGYRCHCVILSFERIGSVEGDRLLALMVKLEDTST